MDSCAHFRHHLNVHLFTVAALHSDILFWYAVYKFSYLLTYLFLLSGGGVFRWATNDGQLCSSRRQTSSGVCQHKADAGTHPRRLLSSGPVLQGPSPDHCWRAHEVSSRSSSSSFWAPGEVFSGFMSWNRPFLLTDCCCCLHTPTTIDNGIKIPS